MLTEEKVFERKRFIPERMLRFGFQKTDAGYQYGSDFLDGEFSARLVVTETGRVTGKVIDKMNGEEYAQLRNDAFQDAYVNSVRDAYEKLLARIAGECCEDLLFSRDQSNRITRKIARRFGVEPDHPWKDSQYQNYGVFRHQKSAKWFALILNVKWNVLLKNGEENAVDIVNLKASPERIADLILRDGVYPAYNMNRKYWITVTLDDRQPDEEIMALIEESFRLTEQKKDSEKMKKTPAAGEEETEQSILNV